METNTFTMETFSVTAVTTQPASATQAASAMTRPSASAEGHPSTVLASDATDKRPTARTRPEPVSRFLLISFGDGAQHSSINPFQLHRAISRFGEAIRVTRRSDGKVEVQMRAVEGARKLLNSDNLSVQTKNGSRTVPIVVHPHPTKGFVTGVITVPDLGDVEEEDILDELRDQGVQRVRRLLRRENGNTVNSDTFVLSFSQDELPEKVRVTWRSVRVRPYIPNPVRCFKCQAYGHMASACKGKERCARCSAAGHNSSSCEASKPRCTCGGEHEAWSRECPRLEAERKKVKERVTGTAKRAPAETHPTNRPNRQPGPAAPSGQQPQPAPESTAYRDALVGEARPPQVSASRSPPPVITLETKIQDCMQLSLEQFLALLGDHCRVTQPSKGTSTLTRDIGVQCSVSGVSDTAVQTDPPDYQDIPEAEIHITSPNTMEGDVSEAASEASGKRSLEESPGEPSAPEMVTSNPAGISKTTPQPPETPSSTKRARVSQSQGPLLAPSAKPPLGEEESGAERAIPTPTSANDPGAKGDVVRSTLRVHIGPPDKPETPAMDASRQNPVTTPSEQTRSRQRIGWPENSSSQMRPPPLPTRPPPISARLGAVSSVDLSAAQMPSERSNFSDGAVRSRSVQRAGRRSESTSRERPYGRRCSYSGDNVHES